MPGVKWFGTKREEDTTASPSHLRSYLLLQQWTAEQAAFFMPPNGVIQICKASVPALGGPKVFPNQGSPPVQRLLF